MIVSDMIRFIERDLRVFGGAVVGFIIVLLALAFHRPRWVVLPVLICAATAVGMLGAIGLLDKPLTVVSSNFLPVLLIVTLSLVIHLIVRHEELRTRDPHAGPPALAERILRDKFAPCLYTAPLDFLADAPDAGLSGSYWFNSFRFGTVREVHDYLAGLPETGKVLSLATSIRMLEASTAATRSTPSCC